MIVVDYFARQRREWMLHLRLDHDVAGVARYLTNAPADPKCFSSAERDDAAAAGLAVHLVYETTGGSPRFTPSGAAYFTADQGTYDAAQAIARLHELGAPVGTVVYFSVDVDVAPELCDAYFTVVDGAMRGAGFFAGVYGFERMIEHAREAYPFVRQHLWQTYGVVRGPLDLWQHEQRELDGVLVDVSDANAIGWKPGKVNAVINAINVPRRSGQSADVQLKTGEVAELQGIFDFAPAGPGLRLRSVVRKVVATKPGRYIVTITPPVDPDADETQVLDAEPAVFVVDVLDGGR